MKSLFVLISLSMLINVYPQTFDSSEEAVRKDIITGFGFCYGQKLGLERVKNEIPELKMTALQLEYKFQSIFGKSCDFFSTLLPDQTRQALIQKIKNEIPTFELTPKLAKEFLERVQNRGNGKVESPFIETLLTWHPDFRDNPDLEFTRGFTKRYSTLNHVKAKGQHLELNVPISWKAREGNRPNIVQFFRSKNGFSNISFSVMVRDATPPKGVKITQKEIDSIFSTRGLREFVEGEGTLIEAKPITLEGIKGGFWIIDASAERLDQKVSFRMAQYGLFHKNRLIMLQFIAGGDAESRQDWLKEFEKNRKLFQLIANSLVLMDNY